LLTTSLLRFLLDADHWFGSGSESFESATELLQNLRQEITQRPAGQPFQDPLRYADGESLSQQPEKQP
jgi:hypothetical protein